MCYLDAGVPPEPRLERRTHLRVYSGKLGQAPTQLNVKDSHLRMALEIGRVIYNNECGKVIQNQADWVFMVLQY